MSKIHLTNFDILGMILNHLRYVFSPKINESRLIYPRFLYLNYYFYLIFNKLIFEIIAITKLVHYRFVWFLHICFHNLRIYFLHFS